MKSLRNFFRNNQKGCTISMIGAVLLLFAFVVAVIVLTSCSAPKAVEERQHHRSEVDTMAVRAVVDGRLLEVKEQVKQEVAAAILSQQTEQQSQEQEKERITESITTWVDSLGREMRQEQRTTERDISRQQLMREERMQQMYEQRLLDVVDSMSAAWQEKLEQVQGHREEADSAFTSVTPTAEDNRPWYRRVWDAMGWMLIGAEVCAVLWFTRKLWLPLMKYL